MFKEEKKFKPTLQWCKEMYEAIEKAKNKNRDAPPNPRDKKSMTRCIDLCNASQSYETLSVCYGCPWKYFRDDSCCERRTLKHSIAIFSGMQRRLKTLSNKVEE